MRFNDRSSIAGKHAFLSPSNYHWINYTDEKLVKRWHSSTEAARGTALHDLAHQAIQLGVRLPDIKETLCLYVNDAIDLGMTSEQGLYYSRNCFGHADAISFREMLLRIHDLKNGVSPASHHQLEVYTALFCLEYEQNPFDIDVELRIYQHDQAFVHIPEADQIMHIMEKIKAFDKMIEAMKEGPQ